MHAADVAAITAHADVAAITAHADGATLGSEGSPNMCCCRRRRGQEEEEEGDSSARFHCRITQPDLMQL
jgi:hypothetical protein